MNEVTESILAFLYLIRFWRNYRAGVMYMKQELIIEGSENCLDDIEDVHFEHALEEYAPNTKARRQIEDLLENKRLEAEFQYFFDA